MKTATQPHIKLNSVEKNVLLPGDPGRIDRISKYLENFRNVKSNREFRAAKGSYKGINVSIVSSGIGCPAAAIAVEELANVGAETIIRIGTCGGLLKEMQSGDIVIPDAALCSDGTTREYKKGIRIISADSEVAEALRSATKQLNVKYLRGINRTHDAFYEPIKNFVRLEGKNVISSEMECSAVFLVAKLRKIKAGAILVVNTPEPPEEVGKNPAIIYQLVDKKRVQKGMSNAIKIALEAIALLEKDKRIKQKNIYKNRMKDST